MEKIIGREKELEELGKAMTSQRSELIMLNGRRRVGKTFLVRSFFNDRYTFHFVGRYKKSKAAQLEAFRYELVKACGDNDIPQLTSWKEAFRELENYLEQSADQRKVIFLDEIPWMDRNGNELIGELEDFWNAWVTNRDDIVMIVCGSATAWMRKKFDKNRGGLHRRLTHKIYIRPFYLSECREYLQEHDILWDDYQIMQCYMVLGGIPYYLSLLDAGMSLPENIDNLFFKRGGQLQDEYEELFPALFNKADKYIDVVKLLASKREGFSRQEIEKSTGYTGGSLTTILENLEDSDFISRYAHYGYKDRNTLYRLCDFFILFYFRYIEGNNSRDEQYWSHHFRDRSVESWEGFTFEQLCLWHLPQIKQGLGIAGIATESSAWKFIPSKDDDRKGAQIDLVISRADNLVHLCEMKFSSIPYAITKDYAQRLQERKATFIDVTNTRNGIIETFVTPYGLAKGIHSSNIHSQLTAKHLFMPLY